MAPAGMPEVLAGTLPAGMPGVPVERAAMLLVAVMLAGPAVALEGLAAAQAAAADLRSQV